MGTPLVMGNTALSVRVALVSLDLSAWTFIDHSSIAANAFSQADNGQSRLLGVSTFLRH